MNQAQNCIAVGVKKGLDFARNTCTTFTLCETVDTTVFYFEDGSAIYHAPDIFREATRKEIEEYK